VSYQVAQVKSLYWGAGFGQTKHLAPDIAFIYDRYWADKGGGLHNSFAETLATFGLIGVSIKLFLELYLFFKKRVYTNYYLLGLFLFIFVYQFTGSFITNVAEYVIWILIISRRFPEFDIAGIQTVHKPGKPFVAQRRTRPDRPGLIQAT
jgi:hypothetical protein